MNSLAASFVARTSFRSLGFNAVFASAEFGPVCDLFGVGVEPLESCPLFGGSENLGGLSPSGTSCLEIDHAVEDPELLARSGSFLQGGGGVGTLIFVLLFGGPHDRIESFW